MFSISSFKIKTALSVAALALPFAAPALNWPLGDGVKLSLTSTFGESRITHFHDGLDLATVNVPVHPVEEGEILYYRFRSDFPYGQVMGPGNFVLLSHAGGRISSYYHLADKAPGFDSIDVGLKDTIGRVSNSGHSAGPHLHFNVLEKAGRRSVNVLSELPSLEDPRSPNIEALFLYQTAKKQLVHIAQDDSFAVSRDYPVMVAITDAGNLKSSRRGIHSISVTHNGNKVVDYNFDHVEFTGGKWKLHGEVPFDEVFFRRYYLLRGLKLQQGLNVIKVECADLKGNRSTREFRFNIERT